MDITMINAYRRAMFLSNAAQRYDGHNSRLSMIVEGLLQSEKDISNQ